MINMIDEYNLDDDIDGLIDINASFYRKKATFRRYAKSVAELLNKKNTDYKGSVFSTGIDGVIIRLFDKVNRMVNLMNGDSLVLSESTRDTMMDIAGYGIIGMIILDRASPFYDQDELKTTNLIDPESKWYKELKELFEEFGNGN